MKNIAKIEISVCMGSSCFTRGNNTNVGIIQDFIIDHKLDDYVTLRGKLCEGKCDQGPNIHVNGDHCSLEDTLAKLQALADELK